MFDEDDKRFMKKAYNLALRAYEEGEVPIGAVIVREGKAIGEGYNQTELLKDATAHAEMIAITAAENSKENWRLNDCTLYVTVEPCMMCTGAVSLSRIGRIVYGLEDPRMGFISSKFDGLKELNINKAVTVERGLMREEIYELMQNFFMGLRERDKNKSRNNL
ncbi:MAG TPA: nucleoside deaminase [Clostridiales bacterium]|nr:nucleoside deaminase [Clostridiales bacterium]HQP70802.1 nucleoside deaminase [Clostridiales bacterium]